MALSILEMVLPVLLSFALGAFLHRRGILSQSGQEGLKTLVGRVLLPVVLFNAFFTAHYDGSILLSFSLVYGACALGLAVGFALRRFLGAYGKFLPFLLTNFEGGMLGYALFGLLYPGQTSTFAMVDIGQTLAGYTTFLIALTAVSGEKASLGQVLRSALGNPAFLGAVLGVLLGVLGIGKAVLASAAGPIVQASIAFLSAPVSCLILLIVGYDLGVRRALLVPVAKTLLLRVLLMGVLAALSAGILFSILPFEKPLMVALLLAFSLPAPFIIPLYADVRGHEGYISTTLSIQTVLSILLFIGIAAYSLA